MTTPITESQLRGYLFRIIQRFPGQSFSMTSRVCDAQIDFVNKFSQRFFDGHTYQQIRDAYANSTSKRTIVSANISYMFDNPVSVSLWILLCLTIIGLIIFLPRLLGDPLLEKPQPNPRRE